MKEIGEIYALHLICRDEPMCSPGIGSYICNGIHPAGASDRLDNMSNKSGACLHN
jgi:hypothetical protein